MAALHDALQALAPVAFADVPTEHDKLGEFMQAHLAQAQLIAESVPPPPPPAAKTDRTRRRSGTATSILSAADMSTSAAASEALVAEHAALQKHWGRPVKLAAKDNPMDMAVYKLAAKDGRGAWFARRSAHEGLPFDRWREALLREFPESLAVQGAAGEGNVRGIGGETRLENVDIDGIGTMQVYRLSAQFPGPTTPRDFVTLLLTSSNALRHGSDQPGGPYAATAPRHFIVISKPCAHPDAQPQAGFIRGSYESVEIIREIPRKKRKQSNSATELLLAKTATESSVSLTKDAVLRAAQARAGGDSSPPGVSTPKSDVRQTESPPQSPVTRSRGTTLSFAESRGAGAKGEAVDFPSKGIDESADPVEWIMVTRSDPGGNVPRFMVERGTPSSIVGDAKKFLDWACSKDFADEDVRPLEQRSSSMALQRNATLAGVPGQGVSQRERLSRRLSESSSDDEAAASSPQPAAQPASLLGMAQAAYAGLESYASQTLGSRLSRSAQQLPANETAPPVYDSSSSSSSVVSFASAEDYMSDEASAKSKASGKNMTPEEKELAKLESRKAKLTEKLQKTKAKQIKDQEQMTEREAERARKADEKHAREVAKAEERHVKELRNLEARRRKEERKLLERQERQARRERERVQRGERGELRSELEALAAERDLLQETCRQLQAENTRLVAGVGKLVGGEDLLRELGMQSPKGEKAASVRSAGSKPGK